MDRSKLVTGGLLLAAMVVVPGMINFALVDLGYENVGDVVYVLGYTTGISLFYLFYLRPVDFSDPTGQDVAEDVETADPNN
ncbi:hypothetical protein GJ629_04980 [Halapricum sp. CBA1109]|uniref:hypothetical protein n=1 Tax=Halapricum sp. CBA1109 TaxID=2668068 RepID=UPI0012FC2978|nr:hypothetical protein [Halapricum sp. CBA1109]MUV89334.1 hypothetical protein [Halapricum sp. CBA1109]